MSEEFQSDKEKDKIIVFQYNDELNEYQELEIEGDIKIVDLLDPDFILLFVDPTQFRVWIWHGSNTTTRMKFIAAKLAPTIRDRYGIGYKISAVDEANETFGFKVMAGVEKAVDFSEIQKGPAYEGTEEDLELLDSLSREKILLLLEKAGVPEGYERKMVIVKNTIYGYREYDSVYLDFGELEVKVAKIGNQIKNIAPEYERCKEIAVKQGIPLKDVYDEAKEAARKALFEKKKTEGIT